MGYGGTHVPPFFFFCRGSPARKARKLKLIFLNIAINHKITNNPWYGPPHFMEFSKL